MESCCGTRCPAARRCAPAPAARAVAALAGNPNSGKTTLFNALTGSHQRVGNWPGVTVERREGALADGGREAVRVVDLPGIYSLAAGSEDEVAARDFLLSGEPGLVVSVVDATSLSRGLFLTIGLLEMKVPVLVVLTMMDLARRRGIAIDAEHLAGLLDCPVVAVDATSAKDAGRVGGAIRAALDLRRISSFRVSYAPAIESCLAELGPLLAGLAAGIGADERWVALELIGGDAWIARRAAEASAVTEEHAGGVRRGLRASIGEEPDVAVADARFALARSLSGPASREPAARGTVTERVDRVLLNRFLALPIFLAAMYLTFWFTMSVGGAFVGFFDRIAGTLFVDGPAALLAGAGAPGWLIALAAGGLGAGLRAVAAFVPVLFAMFLALAALEESGYMARAAFVMDRIMRCVGLPGRAFVPMMVGFGCTVPAIMSTRTLETRRDRFMTIFMAPSMSCGARLPVYAFFAAAFFPDASGAVVFSLYAAGVLVALLTGLLLKSTLFRGAESCFVMELPPYHVPRVRAAVAQASFRLKGFVMRAGAAIALIATVLGLANTISAGGLPARGGRGETVLSAAGKVVAPVFEPMGVRGDNWPAAVALLTGLFAKEAVVGTLSSLYGQGGAVERAASFDPIARIREALASVPVGLAQAAARLVDPLGLRAGGAAPRDAGTFARLRERFSPAAAYAYLLFVLLYFPCVASMGAALREMGAGLALALAGYLTAVAWSVATLFYQLAAGPRPLPVALALAVAAAVVGVFALAGRSGRDAAAAPMDLPTAATGPRSACAAGDASAPRAAL